VISHQNLGGLGYSASIICIWLNMGWFLPMENFLEKDAAILVSSPIDKYYAEAWDLI